MTSIPTLRTSTHKSNDDDDDAMDNINLSELDAKRVIDEESFIERNSSRIGESVAALE